MTLCPKCGCDQEALAECCISPEPGERRLAWAIIENCPDCKEAIEQLRKPKLSFECHNCSAVFADFKSLVDHYHQEHITKFDLKKGNEGSKRREKEMTDSITRIKELIIEYADCRNEEDPLKVSVEIFGLVRRNLMEEDSDA